MNKQNKQAFKQTWTDPASSGEEEVGQDIPNNFKKFTVLDKKIVWEKPKCQPTGQKGESYNGPEQAKQVDLADPHHKSKMVWIATNLEADEETILISTLKEYKDVFAWSYKDLKGVDPQVCSSTQLHLRLTQKPRNKDLTPTMRLFPRKSRKKLINSSSKFCL